MNNREFREARHTLGLTQQQLADVLGTAPTTIRKWEAGDDKSTSRTPNPVAARAVSWMVNGFRPPQWPSSETSQKGDDE